MTDDEILAGLAKAIGNGREAWAGVDATGCVEQQHVNTTEPEGEPHRMLPLCSVCGQRVPLSGALHDGKAWQCLSHTKVEQPTCHTCQGPMSRGLYEAAEWTCMRCWGAWLAGVPEPKELRVNGSMIRFEPAPGPGALDWSDAE